MSSQIPGNAQTLTLRGTTRSLFSHRLGHKHINTRTQSASVWKHAVCVHKHRHTLTRTLSRYTVYYSRSRGDREQEVIGILLMLLLDPPAASLLPFPPSLSGFSSHILLHLASFFFPFLFPLLSIEYSLKFSSHFIQYLSFLSGLSPLSLQMLLARWLFFQLLCTLVCLFVCVFFKHSLT